MQNVLIAGAGKSASVLIEYMLEHSKKNWMVTLMDANEQVVLEKLNNHPNGIPAAIDVLDTTARQTLVNKADIVISILPPNLHYLLAQDCLEFNKHLITSSYVSEEIKTLHEAAKAKQLLFMCEMGLDPGIDHMSTAAIIDGILKIAGEVTSFKSFCGGLMDPDQSINPWQYKITWNPKNIVNAAKQGATWKENGKTLSLNHSEVFDFYKTLKIDNQGTYAYYPNRDSLQYIDHYDLHEAKTFMRATIRPAIFMKAWKYIVAADLTNENDNFDCSKVTFADWVSKKTGLPKENLLKSFQEKFNIDNKTYQPITWLGIFDDNNIPLKGKQSSAAILQAVIEDKWRLLPEDKDMIIMQHQIDYVRRGNTFKLKSTMVVKGDNHIQSAMAKTVGLPMAILAHKILLGKINTNKINGVQIPIMSEVYNPILKELEKYGIGFTEEIL